MPSEFIENKSSFSIFLALVVFLGFFVEANQLNASGGNVNAGDTITIPEIQVNANMLSSTLRNSSGSVSILTSDQLDEFDAVHIAEQLNTVPGVYMHAGTFSTNRIVIRGIGSRTPYSSNRIRAYLNDIPLTNGDGVTTLEDIDASRIGRIEIMKGPNSALYGSGLGGTIKLMTGNPASFIDGTFRYGSFNTAQSKILTGFKVGEMQVAASLHQTKSDGFRENSNFNRYSGFLNASRTWDGTDIQFTLFTVNMNAQIPSSIDYDTFVDTPEKAAANWMAAGGNEDNQRFLSGLTVNHRFSAKTSTTTTLFAGSSNSFEHRPFNDLSDRSSNYGIRSKVQFHSKRFDAVTGVELYTEQYYWSTSLVEDGLTNTLSRVEENRKYANLFALASYRIGTSLLVTAGANLNRLDYAYSGQNAHAESYTYPFIFSPRFGFNYEANASINYYGSIGHGFSAPSLEETLMPNGEKNSALKPETGWMSELGIRFSDARQLLFIDACIYYISLDNLLVTKRITEENFMGINAGETEHKGVELQANYHLLNKKSFPGSIVLNGSYTISSNRFVNFDDSGVNYAEKELPGIPRQTIFTGLVWKPFEELSLNIHQSYSGKQYLNDANNQEYAGYYLLNFNLNYNWQIHQKLSSKLTFGMNNVFDKNYASMILVNAPSFGSQLPRYYYPGLPRNFYFSVSFVL